MRCSVIIQIWTLFSLVVMGLSEKVDYSKYIDKRDDFIDPLDPMISLDVHGQENLKGINDYHMYLDKGDDFIDVLDPLSTLEKNEKLQNQAIEEPVVAETAQPMDTSWSSNEASGSDENAEKEKDSPAATGSNQSSDTRSSHRDIIDGRPYLKRIINSWMRRFERKLPNDLQGQRITFNSLISLDQSDVDILRDFVESDSATYQDVTEVFVSMPGRVSLATTEDVEMIDLDELFGVNVSLVLKCVGIVTLIAMLTLTVTKIRLTVTTLISLGICLFLISVPWEWLLLYKKALARRQKDLMLSVPGDCTPVTDRTWFSALKYWAVTQFSFQDDPCTVYHEAMLVDPILDVTPIEAFTATVTKLFVNPLTYIGAGIGKFFTEIGRHVPGHVALFVMGFVMVVFVLWLIMKMGYQIRLPFYTGLERAPQIEYRRQPKPPSPYRRVQDVPRPRQQPLPSAARAVRSRSSSNRVDTIPAEEVVQTSRSQTRMQTQPQAAGGPPAQVFRSFSSTTEEVGDTSSSDARSVDSELDTPVPPPAATPSTDVDSCTEPMQASVDTDHGDEVVPIHAKVGLDDNTDQDWDRCENVGLDRDHEQESDMGDNRVGLDSGGDSFDIIPDEYPQYDESECRLSAGFDPVTLVAQQTTHRAESPD